MYKSLSSSFLLATLLLPVTGTAVTVHQCEDENGNVTFQDRCPPGSKSVTQKNYSAKSPTPGKKSVGTLTLYMVPDCDTCDEVKEFLAIRNINVNEVDVKDDPVVQEKLKGYTNGALRVPALIVNGKAIVGYNRTQLLSALEDANYSETSESSAEAGEDDDEDSDEETEETAE